MLLRTDPTVDLHPATPDDADQVAGMLAAAFADSPAVRWVIPDTDEQWDQLALAYFRRHVDAALDQGIIDVVSDHATSTSAASSVRAAALWLPRTGAVPTPPIGPQFAAAAGRHVIGRLSVLGMVLAAHQPAYPHHYLAWVGARPCDRRRGLGRALLEHHHTELDAAGQPSYLVASAPDNYRLYQRLGYTDLGEPIDVAPGLVLRPMLRLPGAAWSPTSTPGGAQAAARR
jgi:ribosomal protein S18 acetylase RimI-like enzyme